MNNYSARNPLVLFTAFFIIGILCAKYITSYSIIFWFTISFLLSYFLFSLIFKSKPCCLNVLCLICLISAAALRYHMCADLLPENHLLSHQIDDIETISGTIEERHLRRDYRDKYIIKVRIARIRGIERDVKGKVMLQTSQINKRLPFGALVQLHGKLCKTPQQRNPGQFNYGAYLATKDIYHVLQIKNADSLVYFDRKQGNELKEHVIIPLKEFCETTFLTYLDEESSALLRALLLGEKQDLDSATIRQFQAVGVVHVLAISGLHVGFIIAFIFTLSSILRIPLRYKIYTLLITLSIYVVMIQFKPPVLRASLMGVLILISKLNERKVSVYNIIFGSAFIILNIEPRELFNSGFQFSFIAVLSITYGYEKFDRLFPLRGLILAKYPNERYLSFVLKWIWMPFLVSLSAVLGTLPLTLYYYGMLPLLAVFSNLIVIPMVAVIVFLGIFLLIFALFSEFFARGTGLLIDMIQSLLKELVKSISHIPFASIETKIPSILEVLLALLLLILLLNFKRKWLKKFIFSLFLFSIVYLLKLNFKESNNLEVTFLDVGQGDAHFLRFPNKSTMLIDAGAASPYWNNGLNTILPFLKHKGNLHLNYMVCSHAHDDHIGGFYDLVNKVDVDTMVLSYYDYNSKLYLDLISLCTRKKIPIKYVQRGDQLFPDRSCRVYVLHPDAEFSHAISRDGSECNNSSIVLKVQYGNNGILFTGDLERNGEQTLFQYAQFLESELIKVGHHGSNTSTSDMFLNYIQPLVSVVSVAENNKFGHPSPKTLQRLQGYNSKTYLTSKHGALVFEIGQNYIKKLNWK